MHMLKLMSTMKVLGIIRFYQRHFQDFVHKLALICEFLKKDEMFNWTKGYSKTLKWMKSSMTCLSIWLYQNWKLEFHVHINTSNLDNTIDCPIYYESELLTSAKKNYTTIKKEALAMIYIIKKIDIIDQAMIFFLMSCQAIFHLINRPIVIGKIVGWVKMHSKELLALLYIMTTCLNFFPNIIFSYEQIF